VLDSLVRGGWLVDDGRTTHRCEDMHAFARVTRSERKRLGVRWAEDR
jgi:hypothetical protein